MDSFCFVVNRPGSTPCETGTKPSSERALLPSLEGGRNYTPCADQTNNTLKMCQGVVLMSPSSALSTVGHAWLSIRPDWRFIAVWRVGYRGNDWGQAMVS